MTQLTQLTQARALELLDYNPETGVATWKATVGSRGISGTVAGGFSGKYLTVRIDKRLERLHRVIYLMVTGDLPEQIDHINGNPSDNRWCNLRAVTHAENALNQRVKATNKSGIMGAWWDSKRQRWVANIRHQTKHYNLGRFPDFFEACCARKSAENRLGFHPNHGSR